MVVGKRFVCNYVRVYLWLRSERENVSDESKSSESEECSWVGAKKMQSSDKICHPKSCSIHWLFLTKQNNLSYHVGVDEEAYVSNFCLDMVKCNASKGISVTKNAPLCVGDLR